MMRIAQQLQGGFVQGGVFPFRRDLGQRNQDEGALLHSRVRDFEIGKMEDLIVIGKKIQINDPRTPFFV